MIYTLAFSVTSLGFIALGVIVAATGRRSAQTWLFAMAAVLHGLWALAVIVPNLPMLLPRVLETAHFLGWAVFFGSLLAAGRGMVAQAAAAGAGALLMIRVVHAAIDASSTLAGLRVSLTIDLLAAVLALITAVSVFHAAGESDRWSLKFLCFPLAAVFGYDLYLFAQSLSVGLPSVEYVALRGVLSAFAVPLAFVAAYRRRFWREAVQVSRQAALYSVVLIAVGAYLLLVGVAAMVLRHLAPGMGPQLQVALLIGAVLLLMFLLSAGRTRAHLKLFLSRHFYARKYDYQHEWRKFMQTLTQAGDTSPLENRIIRALADLLEVPGGALWLLESGRPRLQATWNFRIRNGFIDDFDPAELRDAQGRYRVIHGAALRRSALHEHVPGAWVLVPLEHAGALLGVIALAPPRAANPIDAEDRELLLLVARQCASYLAEKRAVTTLEENKQFARFNRQYAFVAHDVKNIISQLSVLLRNFDKHAENPEFQKDVRDTIAYAVERMHRIIGRLDNLREEGEGGAEPLESVHLHDLVARELDRRRAAGPKISFRASERVRDLQVRAPSDRLVSVLHHLLENACEASGEDGRVAVNLDASGNEALLEVDDDGPGMPLDFVRDRLFAPFRSTKRGGFGVGAFQCREFAREFGGDLDVISSPGSGTTMRLRLPLAGAAPAKATDLANTGS